MDRETDLIIPEGRGVKRTVAMAAFAEQLEKIGERAGFKISARGWCYQLEGFGLVNKSQFDFVEEQINRCRKRGFLPVDFVAEEEARQFSGIENPTTASPENYMKQYLDAAMECEKYYTPDWWDGEEYYIQMVVEKIDLKTLFTPVCREYHIPIATSKGWSSITQRAEYAKRFKQAEEMGLKCVLLYCGDHDPDGLRIGDFLRKNIRDLSRIRWTDGTEGYDPSDLIIDRFGLNYDFIEENSLTWIENLITGSGKNLASPLHPNFRLPYVQDYLRKYGERKCEANAIVVRPEAGRDLCRRIIEGYLGSGALDRFRKKRQEIKDTLDDFREETGLDESIREAIDIIEEREK